MGVKVYELCVAPAISIKTSEVPDPVRALEALSALPMRRPVGGGLLGELEVEAELTCHWNVTTPVVSTKRVIGIPSVAVCVVGRSVLITGRPTPVSGEGLGVGLGVDDSGSPDGGGDWARKWDASKKSAKMIKPLRILPATKDSSLVSKKCKNHAVWLCL